jgi:uncharacterized protein YjbI with pentapeptide repeats
VVRQRLRYNEKRHCECNFIKYFMAIVTPAFAIVRPRARVTRTGEIGLLEEIVEEIANEYGSGFIRLTGDPGSGKSTALAHLAANFSYNENLTFLDNPTPEQLEACSSESITIAAMQSGGGRNMELALQPWGLDELIEYMLAVHHDDCGSVIARLGAEAKRGWCPQLAAIVMDRFAADYELHDASDALVVHMHELLADVRQQNAAAEYSLAVLVGGSKPLIKATAKLAQSRCPAEAVSLLRHKLVQLPLAASRIMGLLHKDYFADLENQLPFELIELLGWQCAASPVALEQLRKSMALRRAELAHPMAASILLIAEPNWRPERPSRPWWLAHGYFRFAQWNEVNLFRARLEDADFSHANLEGADFESATLTGANFSGSMLRRAKMLRVSAREACFAAADLRQAKLPNANLTKADFSNANLSEAALMMAHLNDANLPEAILRKADLSQASLVGANLNGSEFSDANLTQANLTGTDLRNVCLNGACLEKATLSKVQMEDVQLLHARLHGADLRSSHLTGSSLPAADLRAADLRGAGLAEIDWEEADLRGANLSKASFHMGSSRSGLVNSPYACEGSKTGFYTDDLDDLSFKRPEEIRKANLRGADLRGVAAEGVDFYLVDLRDAKLDPSLREHAMASGAILGNGTS